MNLWVLMALMCLVAIVIVALPLYRASKRLTPVLAVTVVLIAVLAAGLYSYRGSPDVRSGRGADVAQSMDQSIASLAARLKESPDDTGGWIMLGRSYLSVQRYSEAVDAFEQAVALEESRNPETLVNLAESILARDNAPIGGRTASLFETAVSLDPINQKALFYSGIAASNRGEIDLAAERWERLSTLNPPPEIQNIITRQIAEWRGEPIPEPEAQPQPQMQPQMQASAEQQEAIVTAAIGLSGDAAAALTSEAMVFIIARDPAQPSPPIAVTRRLLSELPTTVSLTDAESMVQGRNLSGFERFELLVRVSVSGQPATQPGDWYGSAIVTPAEQNMIELTIDHKVE